MDFSVLVTTKCNLSCKHCFVNKTGVDMSDTILKQTANYIVQYYNDSLERHGSISLLGGELGIYDLDKLIDFIEYINKNCVFHYGVDIDTNLLYDLTPKHVKFFTMLNRLSTSYDPDIRFKTKEQFELWKNNLRKVSKIVPINCIICTTKQLISYSPNEIFKRIEDIHNLGVNQFHTMLLSPTDANTSYWKYTKANNREEDNWLLELYKIYKEKKPKFKLTLFDEIEQLLFKGIEFEDVCRHCMDTRRTIFPNGDISCCPFTQSKPFFNMVSGEYNINNYIYWHEKETFVPNRCKECNLFKYCKGGCCLCLHDESGCPIPKNLFNYILDSGRE